jgi:hypothetical protein
MPTHEEIFRAKIEIKFLDLSSILDAVKTLRKEVPAGAAKSAASIKTMENAAKSYAGLIDQATRQTHGFSQGLSQIRTDEVRAGLRTMASTLSLIRTDRLLGLRTALGGTGEATNKMVKAIDLGRKALTRLTEDVTKQERALIKTTKAFQQREIAMRNAVDVLKSYGKELGVNRAELNQVTEAIRVQLNATRQQTQAAMANGQITKQGIAQMRNSVVVMREQLKHFKERTANVEDETGEYAKLIKRMEDHIKQAALEVDVLEARAKSAKKSRDEREKQTKSTSKHFESLRKLVGVFGLLRRESDQTSRVTQAVGTSMQGMRSTVDLTNRSIFKMVALFTTVNTAFGAMQAAVRKATSGISQFKNEFLGFGIIRGMLDELFTGVVEFGAEIEQLGITTRVVGEQAGFSVDFINKRLADLKEMGIATAGAANLMIKSFRFGPEVAGAMENTVQGLDALLDTVNSLNAEGLNITTTELDGVREAMINGTAETEEMTLAIMRTAAGITDQTERLAFLSKAYEQGVLGQIAIGRTAQNMSASFGGTTRQATENLANSITRLSTENLEATGIAKNASIMFKEFGEVIGKSADDMGDMEKRQAMMIGLINEGLPLMDVYSQVSDTAGKRISSMSRIIEDTKEVMSNLFLPVLSALLDKFRSFLETLQTIAQSEAAQKLAQQITNFASKLSPVGPVISTIVNYFEGFARAIGSVLDAISSLLSGDIAGAFSSLKEAAIDAITSVALFFEDKLAGAVNWGWNLIANMANGIIEAAQTILTQAVNFVGDIIGMFFAPGSPPKEGPLRQIDKWGVGLIDTIAGAMTDRAVTAFSGVAKGAAGGLAGGLTETFRKLELSSFRMIKDIMGPIQGIFRSMVGMGEMEETAMAPGLLEVRELMAQLADQFEETGEISEEVLNNIGEKLGAAGEDMKKYIRLQFELQSAKDDLKAIDEEIAAIGEAGFVSAALRKKRKDAQARIDALEEQFQLQKELISWQQESNDLVKQQIDLLKRIADQNERAAASAAKGQKDQWAAFLETYNNEMAALETKKALGIITEEEYQQARLNLEKRYIDTAIKFNKPLADERIQAFKALQEQVTSLRGSGKGGLKGLAEDATSLRTDLIDMGNAAAEGFSNVREKIGGTTEEFARMRERVSAVFDSIGDFLKLPLKDKLVKIVELFGKWTGLPILSWFESISETVGKVIDTIVGAFKWLYKTLVGGSIIPDLVNKVIELFKGLVGFVVGFLEKAFGGSGFRKALESLLHLFKDVAGNIVSLVETIGGAFRNIFGGRGKKGKATESVVSFSEKLQSAGETIGGVFDAIFSIISTLADIVRTVLNRAFALVEDVITNLSKALGKLLENLKRHNVLFENLARLGKALAIVLGGLAAAVLVAFENTVKFLSDALEPLAWTLNRIIDVFAFLANVIIETVLDPLEALFNLITGNADLSSESILGIAGALMKLPAAIAAVAIAVKVAFGKDLISSFGNIGKLALGLKDKLIDIGLSAAAGAETAVHTLTTVVGPALIDFIKSPVSYFRSGWSAAMTAIKSSTLLTGGVVIAAVAAWGIALKKFDELMGEVREGVDKSKSAIHNWSEEADAMEKSGKSTSDMVEEFAGRINEARKEFERGGAFVDVLAAGKDVEIYQAAAKEMDDILTGRAKSYEEYMDLIEEYNEQVDVQAMRIITEAEAHELAAEMMKKTGGMLTEQAALQRVYANNVIARTEADHKMWQMNQLMAAEVNELNRIEQERIESSKEYKKAAESAALATQAGALAAASAGRAVGEQLDAVKEAERQERMYADSVLATWAVTAPEIGRMLEERITSEEEYRQHRGEMVAAYNEEYARLEGEGNQAGLQALTAKHDAELIELDRRYEEEKIKRRQAIGEALVDLNERIMKEKLAFAELTGAEAAGIVAQHYQQAQQIAEHYGLETSAAQTMAGASADALRGAALANQDLLTSVGLTTTDMLTLFDKLQLEGYDALSRESQDAVTEMVVGLAILKQSQGETFDSIAGSLQVLPQQYQTAILQMMGENQNLEQILAGLEGMNRTFEPKVRVSVATEKGAGDKLEFMSPKTKLQLALENLVEFTEDNEVLLKVRVIEGGLEAMQALIEGLALLGEEAPAIERVVSGVAKKLESAFHALMQAVVGPTGSITVMIAKIKHAFYSLTATYGFLGQFKSIVTSTFWETGSAAAYSLGQGLLRLYDVMKDFMGYFVHGGYGKGFLHECYLWGIRIAEAIGAGITAGSHFITNAISKALSEVGKTEKTAVSITPTASLPAPTAGLPAGTTINNSRVTNVNLNFDEGAFAGAFPGVTEAEGVAEGLVAALNDLTQRGIAFSWVGST